MGYVTVFVDFHQLGMILVFLARLSLLYKDLV